MKILVGFLAIALAVVTWAYFEKPLSSFTGPLASPSPQSPQGGPAQTDGNPVGFRLKVQYDNQNPQPVGVVTPTPSPVTVEGDTSKQNCLAKNTCKFAGIYIVNTTQPPACTTAVPACDLPSSCPTGATCLHVNTDQQNLAIDSYQIEGSDYHHPENIDSELRIILTKK